MTEIPHSGLGFEDNPGQPRRLYAFTVDDALAVVDTVIAALETILAFARAVRDVLLAMKAVMAGAWRIP